MRGIAGVLLVAALQGFMAFQLRESRSATAGVAQSETHTLKVDSLLTRRVTAGERVLLTVDTTGLVDVTLYESTGDLAEAELFRRGGTPRAAKLFNSVVQVRYPLASLSGSEFWIRIRHRELGTTTVSYWPGTQDEAMGRLRRGENLERNSGVVDVREGLYTMPLYQLVPGTVVELEVEAGTGQVALLKVRDYLDVKAGHASLGSRCSPARCVDPGVGRIRLELKVPDYDDLYVVAAGPVRFRYRVVATPEVLNYISSCT